MPHFLPSPALCRPPSTSHLILFMAGDAWHSGTHSPVSEELFGASTDRGWQALKEDSGGPGARFSGLYSSTLFMLTEAKDQSQIQSLLIHQSTSVSILPPLIDPREHLVLVPVQSVQWASLGYQSRSCSFSFWVAAVL